MRIYISRTTGKFITSPQFNSVILRYDFKRGDTSRIEIGYVDEDSNLVQLAGGFTIDFGLKEEGKYDGDYIVYSGAFTFNATTGLYEGEPSFNTTELNDLLNADDGDDTNDIPSVDLLFEITATDDDGIFSSSTAVGRVFHDVNKGNEASPGTANPSYALVAHTHTDNTDDVTALEVDVAAIEARDWVSVANNSIAESSNPGTWSIGVMSVMLVSGGAGSYPESDGTVYVDRRNTSNNVREFKGVGGNSYTQSSTSSLSWNMPWVKSIQSNAGVISDALTFSGQIELTGQLATTADSAMNRALSDARYAGSAATEVIVTQASDLSGALDSTKSYKLDGIIAMGSQTITVPVGGLTIVGRGNNITGLTTSQASHTLFVDAASDAGSLTIAEMDIKVDGASSKVFDLDNSGAGGIVRIVNCSFTDCTEIGEFDAYFAALCSDMVWFNADQGMTFSGTWGGGVNTNGFVPINLGATGTAFKEGTALSFGSRFISNANMDLQSGATGFSFSESNFAHDGDFELLSGSYAGAGTVVTGITRGNTKCKWRDNNGLGNTYVGSRWALTTETATTIGSSNTYVKMAGTTTYADEQWFSNTTDNAFVYDSTNPIEAIIAGTMSVSAGNNNQLQIKVRQWDDSASAYIDIHEHGPITMSGAGAGENISILGYADLDTNDRIEVWIQNLTSATNITMLEGTLISVSERAN